MRHVLHESICIFLPLLCDMLVRMSGPVRTCGYCLSSWCPGCRRASGLGPPRRAVIVHSSFLARFFLLPLLSRFCGCRRRRLRAPPRLQRFIASALQRSSASALQRLSASAPQRLAAPPGGTSILLVFRRPRWQLKGGTIRRAQNDNFHHKNLIGGHNPEIDAPNLNLGSGPGHLNYFPAEVAHPCARPTRTHC